MQSAKKYLIAALIATAALVQGCGGGGSRPPQQKTATVAFGIFENSTTHIGAVSMSARLPAGTAVALVPGTVELQSPQLTTTKGIVLGTYSSSSRKVNLNFVSSNLTGAGNGTFATLDLTVLPGFTLTQADFTTLNNPFPSFQALGTSGNTVGTTDGVTPTMTVTFGF